MAEACAMLDDPGTASEYLNRLRRNRIAGYTDIVYSASDITDAVREERRKELCFEGHRWFDLRRLGMPEITHVFVDNSNGYETSYTLHEEDSRYALPIPEEVIRRNSNLSQN